MQKHSHIQASQKRCKISAFDLSFQKALCTSIHFNCLSVDTVNYLIYRSALLKYNYAQEDHIHTSSSLVQSAYIKKPKKEDHDKCTRSFFQVVNSPSGTGLTILHFVCHSWRISKASLNI